MDFGQTPATISLYDLIGVRGPEGPGTGQSDSCASLYNGMQLLVHVSLLLDPIAQFVVVLVLIFPDGASCCEDAIPTSRSIDRCAGILSGRAARAIAATRLEIQDDPFRSHLGRPLIFMHK